MASAGSKFKLNLKPLPNTAASLPAAAVRGPVHAPTEQEDMVPDQGERKKRFEPGLACIQLQHIWVAQQASSCPPELSRPSVSHSSPCTA